MEQFESNLSFFDKNLERESEEEFVTNIFQDLVLPRGPVFSVKVQTFKSDPDVDRPWQKGLPDDQTCDSKLSNIKIDQCKSVQVKGPVSSVKVQKFNSVLDEPNDKYFDAKQSGIKIDEHEYVNLVCQTSFSQIKNLKFKCPNCDAEFKQIAYLTQHMVSFHPEPVIKLTIQHIKKSIESKPREVKKCSKNLKLYHCLICGLGLSSKYSLKRHKRTVHEGLQKPYVCWESACDYKSNRKGDLLKHIARIHENRGKKSIEFSETRFDFKSERMSRRFPKSLHF